MPNLVGEWNAGADTGIQLPVARKNGERALRAHTVAGHSFMNFKERTVPTLATERRSTYRPALKFSVFSQ